MRKVFLFIVPLLFCVFGINAQNINVEENAAISLVSASKATLGLSAEDLGNVKVASTYHDNGTGLTMVYLNQTYLGVPVFNQMLVLAYKGGKLVSKAGAFNHSIEKFVAQKSAMPAVTAGSAVQSALSDRGLRASQMAIAITSKENGRKVEFGNMGIAHDNITAQLMWTPLENSNEVRLSWHVYISPKATADLWMVRVDAANNSILGLDNYTDYDNWGTPDVNGTVKYPGFAYGNNKTSNVGGSFLDFKKADDPSIVTTATYRVVPFPAEAPSFPNGAHALRTDPWLSAPGNATTLKWHTGATATDYNYTRSNNVFAYQDRANDNNGTVADAVTSSTAFPNLTFDHTPNYTVDPTQTTPVPNQQFNTTNLFYWNNVIHDVMYVYGFTEATANFQDDNFGRGGVGNDHVNAEAQDGGGTNNANFGTPADGGSGRMQMYLWTGGTPSRDGDVDNGVIVHEYGHGISNRFTGGGSGSCLGNAEQMGEGWSDYYGLMFTQDWATATLNTGFNSPRGIGTYALFQPPTGLGIRSQRYCTDFTVNNKVYLANLPAAPHNRGEIWCATLWDMTWNIINQVGTINPNLYNLAGGGGNAIAMKLVTEGLRLQQCSPGFISSRNAILQADQILYGGLYNCAIWEAFRRRGMGAFASEGSTNSVTDQIVDFTPPITMGATVSATTIPEGSNLNYVNSVSTCSAVSGYTLRDTLPTNVTYVSGGTYDAPNRVVSFAVNQAAGTTNYPFTVNVNPGSYFPPVTLFTEAVVTTSIPASWTTAGSVGAPWSVSTTVSNSAPNSFYVQNLAVAGDQRLATTASFAIPLNAYPELSFFHKWNTEDGWDGGVVEISTNGGTTWSDLGSQMTLNGYNGGLGAAATNALQGRSAFTGLQTTFINTKINLAPYNGTSVMLRFRFGSDDNTTAPTAPEGWWVDDITLSYKAAVNMRSSLFNATNARVSFKDNITEITQLVACNPTINQQPVDAAVCAGSAATFTCVATAVGGVTYQWQISTTGIAGTYTNLANGAPYSNVTTSTLTVNPTTVAMDGHYFRCFVSGTCAPTVNSTPARLSVAAGSTAGTVSPANSQVCGVTNSGTLTLTGHNGSILRWESATNLAGPWTPIANTTATYTFNNITQTTYFRAVVQFGTCAASNSTVATVTFAASAPIFILADPGSTICEGDPTLLTVVTGSGVTPVALTQSSSTAITVGNSVSCNAGTLHTDNSYWRAYNLAPLGLPSALTVTTVTFGVEQATGGAQPVTVRLYTQNAGPAFPGGTRTLVGTQAASVPNQALSLFTVTFGTPVVVPANAVLIVELFTPNGQATNRSFFIGSNAAAQTGTSYLSAADCGIAVPTDVATIGFPNMHIILNVGGTTLGVGGPVTTGTFLWTPAAGLSSTTTNPVAASPMNTTTYTVNHNDGAGCIRQANITITVNKRPVVTTQPANRTSCVGTIATFTVGGTGTGLTYQWQESQAGCAGPWTNLTNGGIYNGVNTATLSVGPITGTMGGYAYRAVLSGTCAPFIPATNVSGCAVLTVNPLPVVAITPAISCGGVAGINGTLLSVGSAPPPVPGSVTVNSGAINVPIPEGIFPAPPATAGSHTITVAGVPANATVTGISVKTNITHAFVGDVVMVLKAPNGAIINLDAVLSATNNAGANFVNTTISSTGTTALSAGTAPFTGTFKADLVGATFTFAGFTLAGGPVGFTPTATTWSSLYSTPNGSWTIAAYDAGDPDVGSFTSWEIKIDYTTPGTTSSPLTYVWSPLTGLYNDPQATIPYTGTNTPQVYAAPTVFTAYTVTATNTVTSCVNTAVALVNYTPPAPAVTPNPVAMCLGNPAVKLKSSSATTTVRTFNSGAINVPIPDNSQAGASHTIPVSGIPANATVTGMKVKMTTPHTFVGDLVIALRAPNNNVLNLDFFLSNTFGGVTTGFSNTIITSAAGAPALSTGTNPYSASFRPDGQIAATGNGPAAPTGYTANMANFGALISTLTPANVNGNYTLAMYDGGALDDGSLTNWELEITYIQGVPATPAVWTPIAGLFSDANATVPYVAGTAVDSVWTRPNAAGVYNYQATVQSLPTPPANVATPMDGTNGNNLVAFNVRNNNGYPVTLSSIASNAFGSGAVVSRVFSKPGAIAGNPGPISAANGWIQFGTANNTVVANTLNPLMSGLTLVINPGQTVGIALDMTGATFPAYSNGTGTIATYSTGGCDIITDGNVGWGGPASPGTPANNPRNFNGTVSFVANFPACTSTATNVVVTVNTPTSVTTQPVNQVICTDKVATFTAVAGGSGPFSYQWQVSTNGNNPPWTNITNGGVYSGATTATLTITQPPVSMNGYFYRVIITGAAPCASDTSFGRSLTVNPLPDFTIKNTPAIRNLYPGLTTTLSATITTPAIPTAYRWLRNGVLVASTPTYLVDIDRLGTYQLSITDANGCIASSKNTITIADSISGKCFIYPNPTSGQFEVRYYSSFNDIIPRSLTIFDAKGDRVFTKLYPIGRPYERMAVDMRAYSKGLYWVEITDVNGIRLTMCRVVIQ